jgi:hypothetical protein
MKTIALCSNVMHFNRCLAQGYDVMSRAIS